jgi:hypothetical protein
MSVDADATFHRGRPAMPANYANITPTLGCESLAGWCLHCQKLKGGPKEKAAVGRVQAK